MRKARHGAFLQVSRDPRCRGMIVDREPDLGQSLCSFCPPSFPDRDMNSSLSFFFFFPDHTRPRPPVTAKAVCSWDTALPMSASSFIQKRLNTSPLAKQEKIRATATLCSDASLFKTQARAQNNDQFHGMVGIQIVAFVKKSGRQQRD